MMKKIWRLFFTLVLSLTLCLSYAIAEENWVCGQCGKLNDSKFCGDCGSSQSEKFVCTQCGYTPSEALTKFCVNCGHENPTFAQQDAVANELIDEEELGVSVLINSRWISGDPNGAHTFLEFYADNTGKVAGMIDCVWEYKDGVVSCDYMFQGEKMHMPLALKNDGEQIKLVYEPDPSLTYTLYAPDVYEDIMRKWICATDSSLTLDLMSNHSFELNANGSLYRGTWQLYNVKGEYCVKLSLQGKTLAALIKGNALMLDINGKTFTFVKK